MGKLERLEEDIDQLKTDLANTRKLVRALFGVSSIECPEKLEHSCAHECPLCGITTAHFFKELPKPQQRPWCKSTCERCSMSRG